MSVVSGQQGVGYTRSEFSAIFRVYSEYVFHGLFKDFAFTPAQGRYFISFREEAGKAPLVTVEKRRIGPDRALFVATTPGENGPREIARSEKINAFVEQLRTKVASMHTARERGDSRVHSLV